jgi:bifunctional UDP-N-acetylglucosamine pyrophosphorylase/glucosamine-1-phosphate N-acetyltransferase
MSTSPHSPADLAAVILAAGRSTRMKSSVPKVLHRVLGLPLVEHVIRAARSVGVGKVVLVVSEDHRDDVAAALAHLPDLELAVQGEPKGTAHAVLAAQGALEGFAGTVLTLMGDAPCVSQDSLGALLAEHRERQSKVSVLSGRVSTPRGYGRIVRGPDGDVNAIIEEKDATEGQRAIAEVNAGSFALEAPVCWDLLGRIAPSPRTGELYLTTVIELARADGLRVHAADAGREGDLLGVNDRAQLAHVTGVLRERINAEHMSRGVTIVDPASTFIDAQVEIAQDVRIEPFVVVHGPCKLERGALIGPFAHVRGGSTIGEGAHVGNFVEVVRSSLGAGTTAMHLAYLGDATVGQRVNVGAGVITANNDGQRKHPTQVGDGASLGSNTVLVAPTTVGAGAVVVRSEVPAGATVVGVPARPVSANRSGGEG